MDKDHAKFATRLSPAVGVDEGGEVMARPSKAQRHQKLLEEIQANPFLTDEDLARLFGVSIQTIRLDRMELDIVELRERIKSLATNVVEKEQFIQGYRVLGELLGAEPGKHAYSLLTITPEMVTPTGIVRPYFLVAQAHTIALEVLPHAEEVFTQSANVKFFRPLREGEKLLASAELAETKGDRHRIKVVTRVGQERVFRATFHIFTPKVNPDTGE